MAQAPDQADALIAAASGIASFSFINLGMSLIERIFAVLFHIGSSIIVFYACKDKEKFWLYPLAILLHTAMDFIVGLTSAGVWNLPVWSVEGVLAIFGVLTFGTIYGVESLSLELSDVIVIFSTASYASFIYATFVNIFSLSESALAVTTHSISIVSDCKLFSLYASRFLLLFLSLVIINLLFSES